MYQSQTLEDPFIKNTSKVHVRHTHVLIICIYLTALRAVPPASSASWYCWSPCRALPNRAMLDRVVSDIQALTGSFWAPRPLIWPSTTLSQFNTKIMSFYNIACYVCELLVNLTRTGAPCIFYCFGTCSALLYFVIKPRTCN